MSMSPEDFTVQVKADTTDFKSAMADCDRLASGFGKAMTSAFTAASLQGQSFGQVVNALGMKLSSLALNAAFKPVGDLLAAGMGTVMNGAFAGLSSLFNGTGGAAPQLTPFARGGIVSAPTYFPMAQGGTGLMGEAGHEAVMPLSRMNDGRLGISASGGATPPIIMNVTTPDAASFQRSEAEVSAMLARMVGRGQRSL